MTSEIQAASFSDSLYYLFFGDGESSTFEPFCEAKLLSNYPHGSLEAIRSQLEKEGRVKLTAEKAEDARQSIWLVDEAFLVRGWSKETVSQAAAIWSRRLLVARVVEITSIITALGTSAYALFRTNVGSVALRIGGSPQAQQVAHVAFSSLGAFHAALGLAVVSATVFWYIASSRSSEAKEKLAANEQTAGERVAAERKEILQGDLQRAVGHLGRPGIASQSGFIAPKEAEWLWIEAVQKEQERFDNPPVSGAELTLDFTRNNPFDVMECALGSSSLLQALSSGQATYRPLIAQLRQIQELYDTRSRDIGQLACKNRQLIQERKQAALNVVDSIYWTRIEAARNERDRALRPYTIELRGYSLDEAREAERRYNNDSRVIQINHACRRKELEYNNYRSVAHASICGWFNPQIQREYDKEKADLKANRETNLRHIGGYYPAVRSLYSWTRQVVDTFNLAAPPTYLEAIGAAPVVPEVPAPRMPEMATAMPPEEPPSDEMASWASAGSGLGLNFFVGCAAAGAGFYATYLMNRDSYEQVIADHRDEMPQPPAYEEPSPPPYSPGFYGPVSSEEQIPPSYDEATGAFTKPQSPVPSAPPR